MTNINNNVFNSILCLAFEREDEFKISYLITSHRCSHAVFSCVYIYICVCAHSCLKMHGR